MPDRIPEFFTFDEAIVIALREPCTALLGVHLFDSFTRLDAYVVHVDVEEPEEVKIAYSGGMLFSTCGEEDFYDLDDVPGDAKALFYARTSDLGDRDPEIYEMTSEYVLQEILPGLKDINKYRDQSQFRQAAGAIYLSFWRQQ